MAAAVLMSACGGGGGGGSGGGPPSNGAPSFTSPNSATAPENIAGPAYQARATDPNGDVISFSIAGGADNARFTIASNTGQLSFVSPPDFEDPIDANRDNVYEVTLSASDGQASASLSLRITVSDVGGRLASRRVGTGFNQPLFLTGLPDGSGRVLVVEKGGLIRLFNPANGSIAATPFLNVATQVSTDSERGLLGLALAPDFATSRTFYVNLTNLAGDSEVRRYRTRADAPLETDPTSMDVILTFPQPFANHNGGWLAFDAAGLLLIASGDGGSGGDPQNNAQTLTNLLGKMLRIDVRSDAFPADPLRDYAIPSGNPALAGARPEILVYGLRNPWRSSIDASTGALYIGDVGQSAREEVNLLPAGQTGLNYGWKILEGTQTFSPGFTAGLTPPVLEYAHQSGAGGRRSVTGGYVYRGPVAQLQGRYVFGDFVSGRIWSVAASSLVQGVTRVEGQFSDLTSTLAPDVGAINNIASFGEDARAHLYILDFDGEIFCITEIE
jgi:glucose/arabinose dehydrogenase